MMTPVEMIERLVGFPTVSSQPNLDLVAFVSDYLAGHGIESRLTYNADRSKANLLAAIGPRVEGGVILSGHTDVVPADGQPWSSDPFHAVERNGRLYGRGTADMKGFVGTVLACVPEFKRARLKVPIYIALSYDEELGCLGVPGLIEDLVADVPKPQAAIIGEPTLMRPATRHKGTYGFRTLFTGRDCHSSDPEKGLNAITFAAEFVRFLVDLASEFRRQGPFEAGFDPPCVTCNVGKIAGGTAFNIVARQCEVAWEFRPLPASDILAITRRIEARLDELRSSMQAQAPEASIETTPTCTVPPLARQEGSAAESLLRELTGAVTAAAVPFGTEAGYFQRAGVPAVVCGPGSIEQAHKPDEFIALSEIEACRAFLHRLTRWASA